MTLILSPKLNKVQCMTIAFNGIRKIDPTNCVLVLVNYFSDNRPPVHLPEEHCPIEVLVPSELCPLPPRPPPPFISL